MFRKRKRKSLSCVHVLQKTWNLAFLHRCRAVTAKKCTKKRDARAKLLFFQTTETYYFFSHSRWRRRRRCLSSLLPDKTWACEQRTANALNGSCVPTYQKRPLVSPMTTEVTTLHELIYPQVVHLPDCKWPGRTFNNSSLWTVLIMLTICKKAFMWYLLLQF